MFKKIEVWILYLVIVLFLGFTLGFGILVRQELVGTVKAGWLSRTALSLSEIPMKVKKGLTELHSVPPDPRFEDQSGFFGSTHSDEVYLLLSRHDGDLQQGVIELVDLRNFSTVHAWNPDIDSINELVPKRDEFEFLPRDSADRRKLIKHPLLLDDGGLVFGWEYPLTKINMCSELEFLNTSEMFHHSIEADSDGSLWAAAYLYPSKLPVNYVGTGTPLYEGFRDDAIIKLSSNGEILYKKSVSEIFMENGLGYLLFSIGDMGFTRDPIHLNDIQPVSKNGKYWNKGDVFLSLRHQSMIVLYRPTQNKIVWIGTGPFYHQHDIDILDEETISVFNNNSVDLITGDQVLGNNEIITYNFASNKYSQIFGEALKKYDVRTITEGQAEVLPSGEAIVEETNYGRTLMFNNNGRLKWTHVNRAINGNVYVVSWSRLLHTEDDLRSVRYLLENKEKCDE